MNKKSKHNKAPQFGSKEWMRWFFKEWVVTLGVAFLVAALFRTTIASPRHIPTGSMIPTIKIGEFIFVNMMAFDWHIPLTRKSMLDRKDPEKGEIVVFEYPIDPSVDYIKRVVATPGDTVEVVGKRVIINGTPLPLEELTDKTLLDDLTPKYDPERMSLYHESNNGHTYTVVHMNERPGKELPLITVPEGMFFVMGDNRDDSQDSRYWGFVPRENFLGRGSFIWFSFDKNHLPFVRLERLFTNLY